MWLFFFSLCLFGYEWISLELITSLAALLPILVAIYVLGITLDRVADYLFGRWDKKLRKIQFFNNAKYHEARTYTYAYAPDKIIHLFEYGRSRIRIMRAWCINHLFLGISISSFIYLRLEKTTLLKRAMISSSIFLFFITCFFLALFTWRKLAVNDYKRLSETFYFLKENQKS